MAKQPKRTGADQDAKLRHELESHQEELLAQQQQLQQAQQALEASRDAYAELFDFAPIPYLTLCRNGTIKEINLTGCAMFGKERALLIGLPFYGFVAEADRRTFLDHLRRCRSGERQVQSELCIRSFSGHELPMLMQSRPEGSPPELCRTVLFDLTEHKLAAASIRELNATLEQRVAERTAELEAANNELRREIYQRQQAELALKEADERKDQFLAMLGHELRNPLAPIRHAAEVLKITAPDDALLQDIRDVIDRQTSHMSRIIDDLLDVSRISRGKITLQFETIDWAHIIREESHDFQAELAASGLTLSLDLPTEPIWVHGDATRLAQVFGNLLHNAHKFTDGGGHVSIQLSSDPVAHIATLAVSDNGIGMNADTLSHLFESFAQADCSLARSRGGLGLGLALVRGVIELHGGQVKAASAGPGQGTTVTVRLPLTTAPQSNTSQLAPAPHGHKFRVLVVDDRRDSLRMMNALLGRLGHEVHTAETGERALEIAHSLRPDVVFSDIGLPGIDGYEVARSIRSHPEMGAVLLVAVTGYGQPEDERRAYAAGFDHHFRKPIGIREIDAVLKGNGIKLPDLTNAASLIARQDSP